ncbi:MAG TPA: Ig-like domain-containing protein [Acidimicrobiales bacterium]|nr:Ig-like domain-containing protein [Acidimicrobiales bacterium]
MRRALMAASFGIASLIGFMTVSATPASATTNPTSVTLPATTTYNPPYNPAENVPSLMTATIAPTGAGTTQISGTVTFFDNGMAITGTGGNSGCVGITVSPTGTSPDAQAQCDITYQSTGSNSITAQYFGDSNWAGSTSLGASENVLLPATVTASAPATAMLNQSVQLSTHVTGSGATPSGMVDFKDAHGTVLCTATLSSGAGHCNYAFPAAGSQTVSADYRGDSTYSNSTGSNSFGTATIEVQKPATVTAVTNVSEVPIPSGQLPSGVTAYSMQFTATVTASVSGPNLAGSVAFSKGGQAISCSGNETVSGASPRSVTCGDSNPEDFGGPIVATYSGDPNWADSSSSPLSITSFTPDPTSIPSVSASPSSPIEGQSVILSAQVSAYVSPSLGPVGLVTFKSGGAQLCFAAVNSSFIATCQTSGFPSGASTFTATYSDPSSGYASSSSAPTSVTVSPTLYGVVGMAATPDGGGYWIARSDGAVSAFGDAADFGSMFGQELNKPIVGIAATHDGRGYWLVASDGGIFSFGDAQFYGSTGSITLNKPIVGMTATPDGKGYYFVASDGGVFTYGDAHFQGSMGATALNQPVVGMAIDGATGGYWLVAADGGIFSFDAPFLASTGGIRLNKPIVEMEAAPDGSGYRFVASDGGVFCYGLPFEGSTGGMTLNQPVVGMAPDGIDGYWLVAQDGGLFNYNAPFLGAATY